MYTHHRHSAHPNKSIGSLYHLSPADTCVWRCQVVVRRKDVTGDMKGPPRLTRTISSCGNTRARVSLSFASSATVCLLLSPPPRLWSVSAWGQGFRLQSLITQYDDIVDLQGDAPAGSSSFRPCRLSDSLLTIERVHQNIKIRCQHFSYFCAVCHLSC